MTFTAAGTTDAQFAREMQELEGLDGDALRLAFVVLIRRIARDENISALRVLRESIAEDVRKAKKGRVAP